MDRTQLMRRVLRVTAVLNFGAALLFAFPGSSLGRLAGLPSPVPYLYAIFTAFMVALFGATYAWLSRQPSIDRPLIAFSAIGKSGFFVIACVCWRLGEVPPLTVVMASGDLLFAAIFASWLLSADRQ